MKRLLYLIIVLVFSHCRGLVIKEKIIDNYYFAAADSPEQTALCHHTKDDGPHYGIIIKPTVFAAGYNKDYIIAKQHPREWPDLPDKSITNYYIVPRKEEINNWTEYYGLIIGPLTELEFKEKRKELGIPDEVTFSIVIKDLE